MRSLKYRHTPCHAQKTAGEKAMHHTKAVREKPKAKEMETLKRRKKIKKRMVEPIRRLKLPMRLSTVK